MKAVEVVRPGGPEVLRVVDLPQPRPGPGQLVAHCAAIGVNFADIYARSGIGRTVATPFICGSEGAGTVTSVGDGVQAVKIGDRIAWKSAHGGYAEDVLVEADDAVPVPAGVPLEEAAAVLVQGLTAHYLTTSTYTLHRGDVSLVHAAAGGVGLLLTQMSAIRGADVIATASTDAKAQLAASMGARDVVLYDQSELKAVVRRVTRGEGVSVVYDGVGLATFEMSLDSLRTRGTLVLFGMSSGSVPLFDLQRLRSGSLFVTRPTLMDYTATRGELLRRAGEVFDWLSNGLLRVLISRRYPLGSAAAAHADLENRRTTGKVLLIPTGAAVGTV